MIFNFLLFSCATKGQLKTNISLLTPQEKQYLTTAQSLYKDFKKAVRSFKKDSVKIHKKLVKSAYAPMAIGASADKADSLRKAYHLDDYAHILNEQNAKALAAINEAEQRQELLEQGQQIGEKELKKHPEYKELLKYKKRYNKYLSKYEQYKYLTDFDSLKTFAQKRAETLDELIEKELTKLEEVAELKKQTAQMERWKNLPEQYKEQMERYRAKMASVSNKDGTIDQAKQEAVKQAVDLAKNHFSQNQDKLEAAMKEMKKLKRKYSVVPNSNDLSTATKRNSLKGEPFFKKLVLGGNFQLLRQQNGLSTDIAPVIGWRFNKRFSIGGSGMYRATVTYENEQLGYAPEKEAYGYRGFFEYVVVKSFFFHGEYENLYHLWEDPLNKDHSRMQWTEGVMVGIGKAYSISGKVKGSIMILYNTLYHRGNSPYESPWNFRFGVEPGLGGVNNMSSKACIFGTPKTYPISHSFLSLAKNKTSYEICHQSRPCRGRSR